MTALMCSVRRLKGMRGQRAVDWNLIDEIVPRSKFDDAVAERASEFAAKSDRPKDAKGVAFTPLNVSDDGDTLRYDHLTIEFDRASKCCHFRH